MDFEPELRQLWIDSWGKRLYLLEYELGGYMSSSVHGLARLLGSLPGVNSKANDLADKLAGVFEDLNAEMATTAGIVDQVQGAKDALHAINAQFSNGAPAGPLPDSPVSSPAPVASVGTPVAPTQPAPAAGDQGAQSTQGTLPLNQRHAGE